VAFYGDPLEAASLSRILADGLLAHIAQGGPRAVIYAAENHNHAAEILCQQVFANIPIAEQRAILSQVRFLNTVIGKMSGVVVDPAEITALGLTPMTPNGERAFLVEVFNRILISRIDFSAPPFQRGITTFVEKDNLLPFEEAKLYGHNATHALGAYLGALLNVRRIADLAETPGMLTFLRRAFIEESGAALIHRYAGLDPLFSPEGYAAYADDLLMRMCNPNLSDTTDRVGRDVERKLGWDDRLIGTLRLGLSEGVLPTRYALGAAAALVYLDSTYLNNTLDPAERLYPLWGNRESLPEQEAVLDLIRAGLDRLRRWYAKSPGDSLALLENL
jgi:mannitol-1-phosphate 5-dehydrogenase